ncbi:protein containing a domain related to multimeric flavodoxin WrbA family [Lachnospiraceae bacterium KM106-2]|nr:protein containing a domain related to multimeric flavodoxin WrbA family [Lachnospiraceae bacterium KM106-2]
MERRIIYFIKKVNLVLEAIEEETFIRDVGVISELENDIKDRFNKADVEVQHMMIDEIKKLLGDSTSKDIYLLSLLSQLAPSSEAIERIIDIMEEGDYSWVTRNYVYQQIGHTLFIHCEIVNKSVNIKMARFYRRIVNDAKRACAMDFVKRPYEERNKDLVIVLASQLIKLTHGPTKTSLDRCYTLIHKLHKKVFLINSADTLSLVGAIPLFNIQMANYMSSNLNLDKINYKDIAIPFIQCDDVLPNVPDIKALAEFVYKMNPAYIVKIGGDSVLSDVLNEYVPAITISLCPSMLTSIESDYQVIGRKLNDMEIDFLHTLHKPLDHVITGVFTSNLIEQKKNYTRAQLNLPEDKFILIVVGGRLEVEVTQEFLVTLVDAIGDKGFIAFAGKMENYEAWIEQIPELKERSKFLGFQDDMLAVLDQCDLYVNPIRSGGGTSVFEAMSKGLPAVTTKDGDVAVGAGEDFVVADYNEMKEVICHYIDDPDFYQSQAKKAIARSKRLCDTDGEFIKILEEAERRMKKGI